MSEEVNFCAIESLLDGNWPGEWGQEPESGKANAIVYRSTDIDDSGHLNEMGGAERFVVSIKRNAKALREGDLLLEASGGTPDRPVGRVAAFKGLQQKCCLASNFLRSLRPNRSVSSKYLLWQLIQLHLSPQIWKYQQQTTGIINLKHSDYLKHEIWVPEKDVQDHIAAIIDSIDEAVEKTESLIAKYHQIKAGLMHDLFTRGVTADGRLRPPREQAPEIYKETPIGWIPKEWQYELLDDLAVRGSGHTPNKNFPEYWNGGIKWISLADSFRLDQLYISDTEYQISQRGIQNSSAVVHPAGTVVLSRDAGIGKSAITTEPMAVSQHFMCWRCDARLERYFLYYWLQFKKRMFENIAMGSTILTIGLPYFKKLRIAAPNDPEEQKRIGERLQSADRILFSLEADLQKKKQQKAGLMQDLLTGKVRVTAA